MAGAGVFDAHLHVVDPRFPLVENAGFVPAPFTVEDYRRASGPLGVTGGAVVEGSFQGLDRSSLRAALTELGPAFVGVAQLPPDVSDAEIRELDRAGVRAVRFNLRRGGGGAGRADIARLGRRVHAVAGWHVELYVDAAELPELAPALGDLPAVVDHLGLTAAGLEPLLAHVARGGYVKATGFGRVDLDVADALRRIDAESPTALLAGTDLPSTRAPRPFHPDDLELIRATLGEAGARRALHDNAVALYRPRSA